MNKSLISLIVLIGTALLILSYNYKPHDQFNQWKGKFGIHYSNDQDIYRRNVFTSNLLNIQQHNGFLGTTFKKGVNQFTILTQEEFVQKHLSNFPEVSSVNIDQDNLLFGIQVDWIAYGAVSPVKDEGSCKANYAFSAIGAIEGANYIWNRNAVEFSVQQIVDCSSGFGNNGCANGRMDNTFLYVKDRGINLWSNYPWSGYLSNCKNAYGIFKVGGYANATGCSALQNALINQPISVALDGNNFSSYRSGIFSNCGTALSLAGLLVGMTDDYWKVKLSWGLTFGQNGYIRLARGNTCGICNQPSYPTR